MICYKCQLRMGSTNSRPVESKSDPRLIRLREYTCPLCGAVCGTVEYVAADQEKLHAMILRAANARRKRVNHATAL